ncbi:AAA family ATPase, partial [Nocardia brasiliensis]|uniref:phosphatase domain-containing protein n=1 Tax=Nocardia brasiliensis TaxID=37326 RepID=UPI0024551425
GNSSLSAMLTALNPPPPRLPRDNARATLFGETGRLEFEQEEAISEGERAQAAALLARGYDVYVDALNLRKKWAQGWANFAARHGADFEIIDLETSVDECVARDRTRGAEGGRSVGEDVIRDLARRFPRKTWPAITAAVDAGPELVPYVPDESLPPAWLVDIDGTLALKAPDRNIYDYTRVGEDIPNTHVVEVVRKLAVDSRIIVLSGRDDSCKDATWEWLCRHEIPFRELHMRPANDKRPDWQVKYEIFDEALRWRFRILGALDDRLQVCRLWRDLGVPLLRVGVPDRDDF